MNTATAPIYPYFPSVASNDDPRSEFNIARRKTGKLTERDPAGRLYPGSCLTGAGRPAGVGPSVTALARAFTEKAIELFGTVMDDEKAPPAATCTAAMVLLDRAWGKPQLSVDLNTRANFADFLRIVGIAARYDGDHPNEVLESDE
jgi:hypothetical protein